MVCPNCKIDIDAPLGSEPEVRSPANSGVHSKSRIARVLILVVIAILGLVGAGIWWYSDDSIPWVEGPWGLTAISRMDMAPAAGGMVEVTMFSTAEDPSYLWLTLHIRRDFATQELSRFEILGSDGLHVRDVSLHSTIVAGRGVTLVFKSQIGWERRSKFTLSGMNHQGGVQFSVNLLEARRAG